MNARQKQQRKRRHLARGRALAMVQRLERAIACDGKDTPENRLKLARWTKRLETAERRVEEVETEVSKPAPSGPAITEIAPDVLGGASW